LKTLWNKIVFVGSAILFIVVAIILLTQGKTDAITKEYEALVNKNRGRRDELKDREGDVRQVIDGAKNELSDIRNRGDDLENKIKQGGSSDSVIDEFQKKYGK
jgi:predicted  nucleic acid-binding Zn-ribbon protein